MFTVALFLGIFSSGRTTISASGTLLPKNMYDADSAGRNWGADNALVMTVASVVEPFLLPQHRETDDFQVKTLQICSIGLAEFCVAGF